VEFTADGKICPYVVAEGKIAKRVTGYYSIYGDLKEAKAMLSFIEGNPIIPLLVKGAMFKAFITQYGKCFTSAWGRGVKLEPDKVFTDKDGLLNAHNGVMEIRNNYTTHAGDGNFQLGGMVATLNPDPENRCIRGIMFSELRLMDHSVNLSIYDKLCQHLLDFVKTKLEEIRPHFNKEMDSENLDALYKRSKMPDPKEFRTHPYTANLNVKGSNL